VNVSYGSELVFSTELEWTPVAGSAKSVLEGVEFGMTNGTTARRCFISQQEIDKWSGHFGAIDQHIAFDHFSKHADEIYAAAARLLDERPFADLAVTAEDRRP
jgi:hypothetical protein